MSPSRRTRPGSIQPRLEAFGARMPGASTARSFYQRDRRHAGSVLAAGLAFRLFLMLLPFALLASSALGFLASGRDRSTPTVGATFGITGALVKTIGDSGAEARDGRLLLLLTGLVLLVYTANSAYRALRLVHVVAWQSRSERTGPLATALAALLLIVMMLWLAVESVLVARFPNAGPLTGALLIVALGSTWLAISLLLPHAAASWRALIPGTVIIAIGLGAMHLVSAYYIPRKLSSTSHLYGALGVAATVMAWLFLGCRLIVAATVLNALLWERGWVLGRGPAGTPATGPNRGDPAAGTRA